MGDISDSKRPHILVAEDDPITAALIENLLRDEGFLVTAVPDGQAAWELLTSHGAEFDTILLDRSMPRLDGLTLLSRLRARSELFPIPVIIATASDDSISVLEGLQAGAYYYLTKPLQMDLLSVIVKSAVIQCYEYRELRQITQENELSQRFLSNASFHYRTMEEVPLLAGWLARLCPESGKVALGLRELMYNAVEHGNLGISYAEKSRLLLECHLPSELKRRQELPENRAKQVEIRFERTARALYFTLIDEGAGFDWNPYLDFDPKRMFDPNGRGIPMARLLSFDGLEYLGTGNTVRVTIRPSP